MNIENFYKRVCMGLSERIAQEKRQKTIFPQLRFAGIKDDFDFWLGKRIFAVLLAGTVGVLLPLTAGKFFGIINFQTTMMAIVAVYSAVLFIVFSASLLAVFYLHLFYQIEGRAALAEAILPDFLMLVASNINAGMTPVLAFRNAARKEFGPLSEEIRAATTKSLGSESFTESLAALSQKIKSKTISETVSFFSQSLRSGGHLAKLLETSANDLRQTQEMKKELVSSTRMYVIFVAFIIIIATPILLAVSVQFLKMIDAVQSQNVSSGELVSSVAFLSTKLRISVDFMQSMAIILLFVNSFLSSLFMGLIGSGKAKLGAKNFPVLFVLSTAVFFITTAVLERFLLV